MTEDDIKMLSDEFFARMRVGDDISADDKERENMREYILSGVRYLDLIAMGQKISYVSDEFAKDLLYNWCLYARSDSTEIFKDKWISSLMELQLLARTSRLILREAETVEEDTQQS
jgi:hypothetical protein|nr:MAG TPA: hypothetical protein [Caudoviricetes sp.]